MSAPEGLVALMPLLLLLVLTVIGWVAVVAVAEPLLGLFIRSILDMALCKMFCTSRLYFSASSSIVTFASHCSHRATFSLVKVKKPIWRQKPGKRQVLKGRSRTRRNVVQLRVDDSTQHGAAMSRRLDEIWCSCESTTRRNIVSLWVDDSTQHSASMSRRLDSTHDKMSSHRLTEPRNAVPSQRNNAANNGSAMSKPRVEVATERNHDSKILSRIWLHMACLTQAYLSWFQI